MQEWSWCSLLPKKHHDSPRETHETGREHCSSLGGDLWQGTPDGVFSPGGGIALHQARSEARSQILWALQKAATRRFSFLVLSRGHPWVWREGEGAHYPILLVACSKSLLILAVWGQLVLHPSAIGRRGAMCPCAPSTCLRG